MIIRRYKSDFMLFSRSGFYTIKKRNFEYSMICDHEYICFKIFSVVSGWCRLSLLIFFAAAKSLYIAPYPLSPLGWGTRKKILKKAIFDGFPEIISVFASVFEPSNCLERNIPFNKFQISLQHK